MSAPTTTSETLEPLTAEPEAAAQRRPGRLSRRRGLALAGAALVGLLLVVWVLTRDASGADADAETTAVATAPVERRDLVEQETFAGTLAYENSRRVVNQGAGTLTYLADEGASITRGEVLYRVDARPVTLLYGDVPAYRRLDASVSDGADVRQLERNLVALGHDPDGDITVDDEWSSATTAAVERWQDDLGVTADGALELGEVVFLPGEQRVGQHSAEIGMSLQPGVELMSTASTNQVVTVSLDATRQDLVAEGDKVEVELPDGRELKGTIAEVGSVARQTVAADGTASDPTIDVTIRLGHATKLRLDQAPVDVRITKSREKGVLAVPVTALVALTGGGHAVEVREPSGATRLVAVETGTFADGYVEVEGDLERGARVVVPS